MVIPDISHWRPVKNWSELKKNTKFVISKATEGTNYIDSTLFYFIRGCEQNGIPYFLYAFLRPGNELGQAKYLVSVCKPKVGKYFRGYMLDVECGNSAAGVQKALRWLEQNSPRCILYTMYAQYGMYSTVISARSAKTAWMEARYGKNNGTYSPQYPPHTGCDLHQYTSNGYAGGIGSPTDLSRLTGTKPLLWFTGTEIVKTQPDTDKTSKKISRRKMIKLLYKTMLGCFGNGDIRRRKLGKYYEAVMAMINHISTASARTLAVETKAGAYGNGKVRQIILGERYKEVQAVINK